jgi:hypothetical protein
MKQYFGNPGLTMQLIQRHAFFQARRKKLHNGNYGSLKTESRKPQALIKDSQINYKKR